MIVEDDKDVAAALADLLTRWQVAFELFPDGSAALAAIAEGRRYGLVLSDYRLPGSLNGLGLIEAVKARHPLPQPEAILITGDFDSALIGKAHARGVPLLHKPLGAGVLRTLLDLPD
jgi:DNA-binding NtrC family response regulator